MKNRKGKTEVKYPDARVKGMVELMEFVREPTWKKPQRIDVPLLRKLVIAPSNESRVIRTLLFLGVIDETGAPTSAFDELRESYQPTLARLIHEHYVDLFDTVPPKLMNQKRLVNFFDTSADVAGYQAKLFVWFCEQAGIELPNVEKEINRLRSERIPNNATNSATNEKED